MLIHLLLHLKFYFCTKIDAVLNSLELQKTEMLIVDAAITRVAATVWIVGIAQIAMVRLFAFLFSGARQ